ncbi:MAG: rRNA maturation RNase YbeY [Anaerolineales bacterium]
MISIVILPQIENQIQADWSELLTEAAQRALSYEGQTDAADLTILLADDAYLQELNNQFMGIDQPTDVLSFYMGEANPEDESYYLGDIAISIQRAQQQANQGGHAIEDELRLLVVHGTLHLLGYDHATAEEKARMWLAQNTILKSLGSTLQSPSE